MLVQGEAQAADVDVDGPQFDILAVRPDGLEQLLAREDAAGIFHEMLEQSIFGRPDTEGLVVAAHAVGGEVHLQPGIFELLGGERGAHAAQNRTRAGDQFLGAEGLGDIIVGAGLQPADAVVFLAAGGQHDDRQVGGLLAAAQAAAHLDAADALDHPVEQHEVGDDLLGEDQRLLAVAGARDLIVGALEMIGDEIGQRPVVFHQQQLLVGHRHASLSPPRGGQSRASALSTSAIWPPVAA